MQVRVELTVGLLQGFQRPCASPFAYCIICCPGRDRTSEFQGQNLVTLPTSSTGQFWAQKKPDYVSSQVFKVFYLLVNTQ